MTYYNDENWDKFIEEFKKASTIDKIIGLFVILCIIGIIFSIYYFAEQNYFIRSYSTILVLAVFIAIILFILTAKKINETRDRLLLFFGSTIFMIGLIHSLGCISLMYSNIPYKTTKSFVHEYPHHRRWFRYGNSLTYYISHSLYFSDRDKRIMGKSIVDGYIPENTRMGILKQRTSEKIPESYSCYLVAYRHNVLLVEIREVKNLGAMSKQECWTQ
ncbi:MAG: tryptophan-rich sensory protein [Neisseriaceae bacterium]|nr:tryptophan-rich sensory protein [Neisseriaceae bacterium]